VFLVLGRLCIQVFVDVGKEIDFKCSLFYPSFYKFFFCLSGVIIFHLLAKDQANLYRHSIIRNPLSEFRYECQFDPESAWRFVFGAVQPEPAHKYMAFAYPYRTDRDRDSSSRSTQSCHNQSVILPYTFKVDIP
jgi:hypothetical protein